MNFIHSKHFSTSNPLWKRRPKISSPVPTELISPTVKLKATQLKNTSWNTVPGMSLWKNVISKLVLLSHLAEKHLAFNSLTQEKYILISQSTSDILIRQLQNAISSFAYFSINHLTNTTSTLTKCQGRGRRWENNLATLRKIRNTGSA